MSMFTADIVPMADRQYKLVPLDKIQVLNSRNRDKSQFEENVKSISDLGILKPVTVNCRNLKSKGYYELVCGEGRLLAYRQLGKDKIPAAVIDVDQQTALLCSLVENIARVPPDTMWFAREMYRMKATGMPLKKICQIVGKTETYVSDYINLVEMGEERLIKGVEQGLFSMSFAAIVAKSSTEDIQHVLMDAFDSGLISSANATKVRNLIELRMSRGKQPAKQKQTAKPAYSLKDLKRDITRTTEEKEGFVREATAKENRLLGLLDGLAVLKKDKAFMSLLGEEGLGKRPALLGDYGV
jgi:ParB family chromosome partitioning protein